MAPQHFLSEDENEIGKILQDHGFTFFGFSHLERPLSLDLYRDWLKGDFHGDMQYLEKHLPSKEMPQTLLAQAKSAIVVGVPYLPTHPSPHLSPIKSLKVASYAQGHDYHHWLSERLSRVEKHLRQLFKEADFRLFTDSGPVLERDLAYRAGLGWIGKNTCLIHQKEGSFFLLGEIYTTLDLGGDKFLHPDRCGTCNRCVEACPTQALRPDRTMDARRCIAYLNIEAKNAPAEELRSSIGDWFFGCDICQAVCPWNEKAIGKTRMSEILKPSLEENRQQLIEDLRWVLSNSSGELNRKLKLTALSRARGTGLKRNAIIVAANLNVVELKAEITKYLTDLKLKDLARWALKHID